MTRTAAALAVLAALLTGCSGGADDTELTVLAAASLTDVLEDVAADFEEAHPGVDVRVVAGSSTTLAEQAADGAPGDVLATADEESMTLAAEAQAADPVPFATNELVLAVPHGNPGGVTGVADIAGARWVRCADDVPCGRVGLALLGANAVTAEPASLEVDVRAVLAKVVSGEADAGLVYRSDAVAAGDAVEVRAIPEAAAHRTRYVAAPLTQSADAGLAAELVEHLGSAEGERALRDAGFGRPAGYRAPVTP